MIASRRFRCLPTKQDPLEVEERRDEGYALIAVLVAVFLVLLALSVAAPAVARALRRDRELEAVHRADQYVRAIQLYYRKFGHYPGSLDQLEKANNIRFLRQRYPDPFTGKPDWRLIKVGTNKTTVKGFFGQPLAGIASAGLGTAAGMSSGIGTGTGPAGSTSGGLSASTPGSTTPGNTAAGTDAPTGSASSGAAMGATDSTPGGSAFGGATSSGPGSSTSLGAGSGIGSQSATSFSGTGAPFLGVGLPSPGNSILTVNEKTAYADWEFLYDPRIEQLRSKVNLLGGGISATGTSSLGSASGFSSTPISSNPSSTTTPPSNSSTPTGNSTAPQ